MARTTQEFLHRTLGQRAWSRRYRPEKYWEINAGSPAEDVRLPVLGQILDSSFQTVHGEDHELDCNHIEFYLVDAGGNEYHLSHFDLSNPTPTFEMLDALGAEALVAEGSNVVQGQKPHESHYDKYEWVFVHLPERILRRLYQERGLVVVADHRSTLFGKRPDRAVRTVFPDSVRVKQAADTFDVGSTAMRLIRFHRNCAEYRTRDGVSIFDNRAVDHSMGSPTLNNLWRFALRRYVSSFQPKGTDDLARRFAWQILHNITGSDDGYGIDELKRSNLIAQALAVFGQSAYIPASILANPDVYEIDVRRVYRDRSWGMGDWVGENVFNPVYVTARDKENARASALPKDKRAPIRAQVRLSDLPTI